jgi:hypothetical protein
LAETAAEEVLEQNAFDICTKGADYARLLSRSCSISSFMSNGTGLGSNMGRWFFVSKRHGEPESEMCYIWAFAVSCEGERTVNTEPALPQIRSSDTTRIFCEALGSTPDLQ